MYTDKVASIELNMSRLLLQLALGALGVLESRMDRGFPLQESPNVNPILPCREK